MLKSSGAMGAATLLSRVLGMVREMVYAKFMGDGPAAGAFQFAFTIPNLFRRLLGEGALTAAFVPIFKQKERVEGEASMWRSANAVICALALASVVLVLGVMGVLSLLLWLWPLSGETRLFLGLLRLMFPYMGLVCLAAVFMSMLNARGHFLLPALGATTLNVAMIAAVVWLAPRMGTTLEEQVYGLGIGVLVAGVLQAGFQLPTLFREGYRFEWISPKGEATVREVVRRMVPGTLGVAAFQINVVMTQAMAYREDPEIVASFNYAVRLMEFPQGLFGVSLATFLLPALSGLAAEKKYVEFRRTLGQGLSHLLLVNLVASVLLVVLAEPIVRLIFERGEFGPMATRRASSALMCLAPGLVLFSMVNILARAFFALEDTSTPMKISVFCLGVNVVITFWVVEPLRQSGLGLANTLTSGVNVGLLLFALRKKMPRMDYAILKGELLTLLPAAAAAGGLAWLMAVGWGRWIGAGTLAAKLGHVFVPGLLGGCAYFGLALWLKNPSAVEMRGLLLQRWLKRKG